MNDSSSALQSVKSGAIWVVRRFPDGSIWQSRYLALPIVTAVSTLSISSSALGYGARALWFLLGIFLWTFLEYVIHRWVFHYRPRTEIGIAILERFHITHHHHPDDQKIVCIPLVLAAPFMAWIFFNLVLLGGNWDASLLLTCGIAFGMTVYDITHFSTHYMKATNPILKALKKQHMLHHFSDHNKRFGVTSPLWDYVFGTAR